MRILHASTLITIAGLAAASCGSPSDGAERRGLRGDIALAAERTVVSAKVAAGATLASLLKANGVASAEIESVIQRTTHVFDPRRVRAKQPFRLERRSDGLLQKFEYEIDNDRFLRVARADDDQLVADLVPIPKTKTLSIVRGRIDRGASSLSAAMAAAGETIDLTLAVADIFGGEIDFSTEIQPGDSFELTVEKQYRDGDTFSGYGPVLAAEFHNAGRRVRAVRWAPPGGSPAYYDERGVSMKRFFLASPLKFQPAISSGFSHGRMHPILREVRAHLGVDYRAPMGSPVVAVADGTVVSAGTAGASGRMVHLRHSNGFETEYLHLSSIDVRAGAHVRQGELIGRVGMTGLATGPHLDYRLKKNGTFINPVTAHRSMPPADPVAPAQMAAFAALRDQVFAALKSGVPTDPAVNAANAIH